MAKWIVILSFAACVGVSIAAMVVGDGWGFVRGAFCLGASCLVYIPMLEELE